MKQTFFKQLKELGVERLNIAIKFQGKDNVVISVLPHDTKASATDGAVDAIKPILLKGTIKDADEKFFDTITEPVEEVAVWYENTKAFGEQKAKADLETKAKAEVKKAKDAEKDKLKKKHDKLVSDAKKLAEHEKPNAKDILSILRKADQALPKQKECEKLMEEWAEKSVEKTLFAE